VHRWAGTVFDAFTVDGEEVWTVEDGGRIRHRTPGAGGVWTWTFDETPVQVKDQLLRLTFLVVDGVPTVGWAVGMNGWYLKRTTGTNSWGHH
jgi:hypothetical protein